jgi:exopolyphosphatase/pppGpp-phosphohydrolase
VTTPRLGAAVDVGSNSVHLLVARITDSGLRPLRDESVLLGLGDVVDRTGAIPEEAAEALVEALREYGLRAHGMGADVVSLVATEPLRRATNGASVCQRVLGEVGLPLHVLTERQEGELTYLGVTGGRPSARSLLVVDIGGGSSEVVLATIGEPLQVLSLPSGSARLSRGIVEHDPPTAEELDALLAAAHRLMEGLPRAKPARAVFVGGTATNLARLAPLRRDGMALAYRTLGSLDAAALCRRYGVKLRRAFQLPAGAAMVDALMAHFHLDAAKVSQASLRDGAIVAADRLGPGWPTELESYIERSLAPRWPLDARSSTASAEP